MTKKMIKKKEKYITERVSKAGTHSLQITLRVHGQIFMKSIKIEDFDTPKQALEFAVKLRDEKLVEMSNGYTVSNFHTVGELYEKTFEFFPVRLKTRKRHNTFYNHGISVYGDVSIEKLTAGDIQASLNKYARTHTRAQVNHFLAVWRLIYKAAFMMNISIPDRTLQVKIPECQPDNPKKKEITSEDLQKFCEALLEYNSASVTGRYESQCIWYAVQVMKYCGLRPAECFALTKDDIHITPGSGSFISVNKAAHSTITSHLEIGATKTAKSVRNVPIPEDLKPILKDCMEWTKHDIIFADFHGNLQQIDYVSNYVHLVAKKTKVQFNLYMLRHQLSPDLFTSGTPANIIRDIMGHESASMSLDYAVSNENDRIQAVNNRRFS